MAKELSEEALPAPTGRRALAWLFDLLIVGIVALLVTSIVELPERLPLPQFLGESIPTADSRWLVVFAVGFFVLYHTSSLWLTRRTAGKAMFGLRLRQAERRSGIGWTLGRTTLGYVVVDVFGAGFLLSLLNPRRRCLHDLVFGTEVVLERPGPLGPRALWAAFIDFEDERQLARDEKTKSLRLSKGFAKFLLALGSPLTGLLSLPGKASRVSGRTLVPSLSAKATTTTVGALSVKATAAVVVATTGLTAGIVASPPVREAVRTFLGGEVCLTQRHTPAVN